MQNIFRIMVYPAQMFCEYEQGDILKITWNRGNGDLIRDFVLDEFKNGAPLLRIYDFISRPENPVCFDVSNPEIEIKSIERIFTCL